MKTPSIFLPSDMHLVTALKHIAEVLTKTEGLDTIEKRDEIFDTVLQVPSVKNDLQSFFNKKDSKAAVIFKQWVLATGVTQVIELRHEDVEWCFTLNTLTMPLEIYNTASPNTILQTVALDQRSNIVTPTVHVYADSRIYKGHFAGSEDNIRLAIFNAFKANIKREIIF